MRINGISLYNNLNQQQNIQSLQHFEGGRSVKPILSNNITKSKKSKTISFADKILDYFKTVFNGKKELAQTPEVLTTANKISKSSEAEIRRKLNIPKDGIIIRNGYEEHYKDGKIVKKILRPEAYAEHTKLMNTRVEYIYDGDELKQIHRYDSVNGNETMATRTYTNLGDMSVAQIRDL